MSDSVVFTPNDSLYVYPGHKFPSILNLNLNNFAYSFLVSSNHHHQPVWAHPWLSVSFILFPMHCQVFFAVLIGAFALGQAGPYMEGLVTAAGSATTIFNTIDRVSVWVGWVCVWGSGVCVCGGEWCVWVGVGVGEWCVWVGWVCVWGSGVCGVSIYK